MDDTKKTGGPAFPRQGVWVRNGSGDLICQEEAQDGASLRDYFAGEALVGIISHPHINGTPKYAAGLAYDYADAMLAEREKW